MPTSTPPPSGSSFFASMTASDWVTAVIAIGSLIVATIALCIPLWKSRTRLEIFRSGYWIISDIDCVILDFILVNRSSNPIAITGLDLKEKSNIPARRYSEELSDICKIENQKTVRDRTTAFPLTIAPYDSQRIIAGFDPFNYYEAEIKTKYQIKKLIIHTSRIDKTINLPYQTGKME